MNYFLDLGVSFDSEHTFDAEMLDFFKSSFFIELKIKWNYLMSNHTDPEELLMQQLKEVNVGFVCLFYFIFAHKISKDE